MSFIGSQGFEALVGSYRLLWVRGRFGSGKTAISLKLAEYFLKRGYRLITNTPCIWSDGLCGLNEEHQMKAVVIIDEAGLGLKVKPQLEAMSAYARKMDCIYIFPSFFPPVRSAQVVTLQPLFSMQSIGLPFTVLEWRVNVGGFKEKGWFIWSWTQDVWGIYSTSAPESAIDEIINHLSEQVQKYREAKGVGRSDSLSTLAQDGDGFASFADSVETLAETADALSSVSLGRVRTRRL